MHELSIISHIVEIATTEAQKVGMNRVEAIELEIGELAGIEFSALDFAWEVGVSQSVLENAECLIHRVAGKAKCGHCGKVFDMQVLFDPCPECGSYENTVIKGKELVIKTLTFTTT
ncbi:MAG: hydrogenase maturation nickel metallochaperone HypA [Bacteroidia bacterium]|nr:hydrogenase maturation nickel metallochaperone HypA [Bacteroidia bacterium]